MTLMAATVGNGESRSHGKSVHRKGPRYLQHTVSSAPPEYANQEQDVIRMSFSAGNHTYLKEAVPVDIAPDSVHQLRRIRMERGRGVGSEPSPRTWARLAPLWGSACLQDTTPHIPDEYGRAGEVERHNRLQSVALREKISTHEWRHTSQERRLKHETMMNDPRLKEAYPYLGGDKDSELDTTSMQWLRSSTSPNSPASSTNSQWNSRSLDKASTASMFLVGRGKALGEDSRGSRMNLPTVVARLQRRLDLDWEGTTVVASVTDQDLVQIAFHLGTVDSERGVLAYMNVLSKDMDFLGNSGLRKVSQLWGVRRNFSASQEQPEDDYDNTVGKVSSAHDHEHAWMFYLMAPKWVRMRPTDAFYTVHPRSEGSAFRMSAAGSSVLLSLGCSAAQDAHEASTSGSESHMRSHAKKALQEPTGKPEMSLIEQALVVMNGSV